MDSFNDYESEEEDYENVYNGNKKVVNRFYQAKNDYAQAIEHDLDADNVLRSYMDKGQLTYSQASMIRDQYTKSSAGLNKYFDKNPFKKEEPKKPLINSSKIVLKGLKSLPPRQYLLKRFEIERGTLALLCASGSSGKSMLVQYIACCASSGKPLFGKFDVSQGSVIHLDQEQNAVQTQRRYERLAAGLELTDLDIERIDLNRRLDSPEEIKNAEEDLAAAFAGKTWVFIDSLKATSEADENSPQIEIILKILKRVAERTKTGIMLIHHKGKSISTAKQSGRGHSSIYDSVDIQIDLDWNMETLTAELSCKKNRDGKLFSGIRYRLLDTGEFNEEQNCSEKLELQLIDDEVKVKEVALDIQILKVLKEVPDTINQKKLFEIIGGDRTIFTETIDRLVSKEYVNLTKGAHNSNNYKITESGISTLAWGDK